MKGLHLNIVFPTTSNMYNNVAAVRRLQGEKKSTGKCKLKKTPVKW